jgi:hypothetical protein
MLRPRSYRRLGILACTILGCSAAIPLQAGELDAFDGRLAYDFFSPSTYIWGIEYREVIDAHLSGSLVWLNEGHVAADHRDGQALQLWWQTLPNSSGLIFEAGLGPYLYYDTAHPLTGYVDQHGLAALTSVAADWYWNDEWLFFLRVNRVVAADRLNTTSVALGVGYRFAELDKGTADDTAATSASRWELTGFLGSTVQNASHSATLALEARREVTEHVVATAEILSGSSDIGIGWRQAFVAQLWLQQHLTTELSVAAGAGVTVVGRDGGTSYFGPPRNPGAAVSVGFSYAFTRAWNARAIWTRFATNDSKDADMFLFGMGRAF